MDKSSARQEVACQHQVHRRLADEKISHLAHDDASTDLPNRVLFSEQIEKRFPFDKFKIDFCFTATSR